MKIYRVIQINLVTFSLRQCPRDRLPTEKAYFSESRLDNISKSFTHKMAAKTSWHRYVTK